MMRLATVFLLATAGLASSDPSLEAQYFADVRANAGADVLTFRALDVLRRIPREEIRRRQAILRTHGHRLQYAVDDLGEEPDAVETLFVGALGLAHDLAHLYQV